MVKNRPLPCGVHHHPAIFLVPYVRVDLRSRRWTYWNVCSSVGVVDAPLVRILGMLKPNCSHGEIGTYTIV